MPAINRLRDLGLFQSTVPVGSVTAFAGATAPTGWLLCAGQTVSRAQYSSLFLTIGTTYGAGDGSTTFALPDMRGRVPAGKDDMGGTAASRLTSTVLSASNALGATGGSQTHTLTIGQMPSHTHIQNEHSHSIAGDDNSYPNGWWVVQMIRPFDGYQYSAGGIGGTTATNQNTGGSEAHPITQPTIVLNYIIRAL